MDSNYRFLVEGTAVFEATQVRCSGSPPPFHGTTGLPQEGARTSAPVLSPSTGSPVSAPLAAPRLGAGANASVKNGQTAADGRSSARIDTRRLQLLLEMSRCKPVRAVLIPSAGHCAPSPDLPRPDPRTRRAPRSQPMASARKREIMGLSAVAVTISQDRIDPVGRLFIAQFPLDRRAV
jgi:hypothetical protein